MSGHSSVFGVLWLRLCRAVCHRSGLLLRLNSGLRGSRLPGQRLPRAFDCSRATLTSSRARLTRKRARLTSNFARLTRKRARLTSSFATLSRKRARLAPSFARLARKRARLTPSFTRLTRKRATLTPSLAMLTSSRAKLIGVVWVLLGHVSVVVRVDL